jgi:hypothetical protein
MCISFWTPYYGSINVLMRACLPAKCFGRRSTRNQELIACFLAVKQEYNSSKAAVKQQ